MVSESGTPVIMNGSDTFGGMGIWGFLIIALFLFGGMGGGLWGGNSFANAIGYENLATSNELQRGFDNQNSMNEERSRTIVCPKCGRSLTDKDVERHCCPCGAH